MSRNFLQCQEPWYCLKAVVYPGIIWYKIAMTINEKITALLGVLGFLLGIGNLAWLVMSYRPRLSFYPKCPALFTGMLIYDRGYTREQRLATIVDVVVEVSNNSSRDNTVVSISCATDRDLLPLDTDLGIQIGTRLQDLSAILGKSESRDIGVYWDRPGEQWPDHIPLFLPSGGHKLAHLCYQLAGDPVPETTPVRLRITALDAFGRSYEKSVFLKRLSIDETVTPLTATAPKSAESSSTGRA